MKWWMKCRMKLASKKQERPKIKASGFRSMFIILPRNFLWQLRSR
jgi:hypothetical protein